MSHPSITYIRDIPAYTQHTETIALDTGYAERLVSISAGKAASVFLLCTGIDIAGSLSIEIRVNNPEAVIKIGVACTIRGTNECVITTLQHHAAAHATSRLYVRKIVCDQAVATYHGMIHIAKNAVGSDVSQNDKTLFDGASARAESIPAIEVLTDDVTCAHGTALGRIDADTLWYMQSRGISYKHAAELWYEAFLEEARIGVFEER